MEGEHTPRSTSARCAGGNWGERTRAYAKKRRPAFDAETISASTTACVSASNEIASPLASILAATLFPRLDESERAKLAVSEGTAADIVEGAGGADTLCTPHASYGCSGSDIPGAAVGETSLQLACRYCFRRHFPYQDHKPAGHGKALEAIAADVSVTEVILSGGDPLLLGDAQLGELIDDINSIAHVKRIRLHSRLPIVLPQRVTRALLESLEASRCSVTMVVHCNHAQELDVDTARAFACLREAGVHLLNQTVLLHGVNDDVDVLCELSEMLFEQGALPYYLHMPDPVTGTAHFMVSEAQAQPIYEAMRERLPGYLLPRLVREEPGEMSKTALVFKS